MLHVLLLILKITGFLILGILGLLLTLILLVLFVPVRYRFRGSYYEKPEGTVRITWLLHTISVLVSYHEDFQTTMKVLGFPLFREKDDAEEIFEEGEEQMLHAMEVCEEVVDDPILRQPLEEKPEVTKQRQDFVKPEAPSSENPSKGLFHNIREKLIFITQKKEELQSLLQDKENQETGKLILRQIKRLFRHLLPQKVTGSVTFGFDDPYTTGQVLSVASIFYGCYGKGLELTPVFDESVLEGEVEAKGRIRIGTILILGIPIYLNKNFRILLKRWRSKGGVADGR